ncbi:MAG: Penicillin-binding protein 2D [Microgenomates bacterium OLB22]|nr:MAG: Penicillin-binding protein 2D [Microgenomates bacterium OLB22]
MLLNSKRRTFRFTPELTKKLLIWATVGAVVSFLLVFVVVAFMARDLPEPGKITRNDGYSTVFYDRDGKVLFEMYKDQNRIPVSISQVPKTLQQATIAIEDKDFYSHKGFSLFGIARALFSTALKGRLEGGSTLTQQLVKQVLLTSERSLPRKIKEFVLAIEIERRFSKDQILELYLNEAPYGGSFWGVQSAARGYFDKDVSQLTLLESAILAGLPQSPTRYSPYIGQKDAYKGRTQNVLRRLREEKYITRDQEKKALEELKKFTFSSQKLSITAPHFVFYVRDKLIEKYGDSIVNKGLKIKTTLSSDLQKATEKVVHDEVEKIKPFKATNGAAVVMDSKKSQILALVGSYDYNDPNYGRFNVATDGLRQPGSALKPITYAVALQNGYTASSVVMDVQTEFPDQGDKTYKPVNYDGKYRGPVQLRFALGNSLNIPAVKMLAMVGIRPFLRQASEMGLTTLAPTEENMRRFGLSITLGGGEVRLIDLVSAYSVFARGGTAIEPVSILEVKDKDGRKIFEAEEEKPHQVLDKGVAFIISHILTDNVARSDAFGAGSALNIRGKTVAAKTGTTNNKRDNWAFGFTKEVTVGTWVGNNDNTPMNDKIASGLTGASTTWNAIMREALKTYKDGIIEKPDNVDALQIDAFLGGLPKDGYPIRSEYFLKGTAPTDTSPFYKKIKLSKQTGKLANDLEVQKGEYDEKDYIVITERDPVSKDGQNRWQQAIDAWVASQTDEKFKAPSERSEFNSDEVIVRLNSPSDGSTVTSSTVDLKGEVITVEELDTIELFINGSSVKTISGNNKTISEQLQLSDGQVYQIAVKAKNKKGKAGESSIKIGVNVPANQ